MNGAPASGFGPWDVVALIGVAHGFLLAFVLATQERGDRTANRLLAALVALFSYQLLQIALYWTRTLELVPHLWGTAWLLPYLYGPLLYLYARRFTESAWRLRRRELLHVAPFALVSALFARFYLLPAETKSRMLAASYEPRSGGADPIVLAVWSLQFVHFAVYLYLSLRLLDREKASTSSLWLRRLATAFAASFSCWFLYGLAVSLGLPYSRAVDYAATLAMTVSIVSVGYTALRVPELFVGAIGRRRKGNESAPLKEREVDAYRTRLEGIMDEERPYVDANLRLTDLASLVEVSPHELSRLLNEGFGLRFSDFVNRYRVEEAKRLMSDPARREASILELAFEAGFNNKTSFNQAFKKYTRMTPSRYRDEISRFASDFIKPGDTDPECRG